MYLQRNTFNIHYYSDTSVR